MGDGGSRLRCVFLRRERENDVDASDSRSGSDVEMVGWRGKRFDGVWLCLRSWVFVESSLRRSAQCADGLLVRRPGHPGGLGASQRKVMAFASYRSLSSRSAHDRYPMQATCCASAGRPRRRSPLSRVRSAVKPTRGSRIFDPAATLLKRYSSSSPWGYYSPPSSAPPPSFPPPQSAYCQHSRQPRAHYPPYSQCAPPSRRRIGCSSARKRGSAGPWDGSRRFGRAGP